MRGTGLISDREAPQAPTPPHFRYFPPAETGQMMGSARLPGDVVAHDTRARPLGWLTASRASASAIAWRWAAFRNLVSPNRFSVHYPDSFQSPVPKA